MYADIKEIRTTNKQRVWSNTKINHVLPLHNNARPHTILRTRKANAPMRWAVVPQHSV
jgi:hypothetical protein